MLRQRFATAAVGIPLFIAALLAGDLGWALLMGLLAVLGAWESGRLFRPGAGALEACLPPLFALIWVALAYTWRGGDGAGVAVYSGLALLLLVGVAGYALFSSGAPSGKGAWLGATLYPGVFFGQLVIVRELGLAAALFAVLVTWGTDTLAYGTGRLAGRRPLWPAVSPKKTWEGAMGGLFGGALAGWAVGHFAGAYAWAWGIAGAIAAILGQIGDLVESGLKRKAGVKDSGTLLPGHGGVLDRFDSLFFVGVVAYYLHPFMR